MAELQASSIGMRKCHCCMKLFSSRGNKIRHERRRAFKMLKVSVNTFISKTSGSRRSTQEITVLENARGLMDHKCGLCPVVLSNKANKERHIAAIHDHIRPFQCTVQGCCKRFSQKSNRERHTLTHF